MEFGLFVLAAFSPALYELSGFVILALYSKSEPESLSFLAKERLGAWSRFCLFFLPWLSLLAASQGPVIFLGRLLFCCLCAICIVSDGEQQIIFDEVLLCLAAGGIFFMPAGALYGHVVAGFLAGFAFLLLTILFSGSIGGGDIKLVAAGGLWLGSHIIEALLYGVLLGGLAALVLLLRGRGKNSYFAYGPYLIAGMLLVLFS